MTRAQAIEESFEWLELLFKGANSMQSRLALKLMQARNAMNGESAWNEHQQKLIEES